MLIRFSELIRAGGVFEESVPLAIRPLLIDTVRPEAMPGFDGPSCRMELVDRENPTFVEGSLDSVLSLIQAADETAIEKLQVIADIATGEPQV